MSGWTYTVSNSVRTIDPVGHASRQPARSQCLQTSDENSHETCPPELPPTPNAVVISTNFTCRHVEWPRCSVLSYEWPDQSNPSAGTWFHSLHATSHALQPMQSVESVRNAVVAMHQPLEVRERLGPAGTPARRDVAGEPFRFHDPRVRLLRHGDEIVRRVAGHQPARAPVVGKADLMDDAAVHAQRRHAGGDQRARLDHAARRGDRQPAAVGRAD